MGMTVEAGNRGDGHGAAFTLVFPTPLIVRAVAPESVT
jgi:two-component system sensor histidine kinase KdpD